MLSILFLTDSNAKVTSIYAVFLHRKKKDKKKAGNSFPAHEKYESIHLFYGCNNIRINIFVFPCVIIQGRDCDCT